MLVYQRGKILMAWTVVGGTLNPVASMGLVNFPTCTIKIKHPCRCIYIYPTWIQWQQDEKIVVETLDQEAESPPHRIAKAPVRRLGGLGFQPGGGNLWETKNAAKYIHPSHFFLRNGIFQPNLCGSNTPHMKKTLWTLAPTKWATENKLHINSLYIPSLGDIIP